MALELTSGPALEPITVAEAKAHARIDNSVEDVLINSLILTSRLHVEAALGLALMTQSWTLRLDRWPKTGSVLLPLNPVQAVSAVRIRAADGTPQVLDSGSYDLDKASTPARLVPRHGAWPAPERRHAGIEIAFTAGFGSAPADVPEPIRHALKGLVAHWYENRDPFQMPARPAVIPQTVNELLQPYRTARL